MVKSKMHDEAQKIAESSYSKGAFPTATFVVGLGDLGGDILHQLAERWTWVATDDPSDPTLGHLSLLHLHSDDGDAGWEQDEAFEKRMAAEEGSGEDPELALNFLILRTLGLIRVHDGCWQIACPVDDGSVRLESLDAEDVERGDACSDSGGPAPALPGGEKRKSDMLSSSEWNDVVKAMSLYVEPLDLKGEGSEERVWQAQHARGGVFAGHRVFRRRYFKWLHLAQDPLVAARNVVSKMRGDGSLAQFIEPLLARVRVGSSPQILLHALRRRRAWEVGRDPSPWRWLSRQEDLRTFSAAMARYDKLVFGESYGERQAKTPPLFQYHDGDVHCPIEPWVLLSLDWASPGWTFMSGVEQREVFRPLPNSPFAFGFFDYDDRREAPLNGHVFDADAWNEHTALRMKELAEQARCGLVRLWGDLTRQRRLGDRETDDEKIGDTGRAATLRQSLELLGEFVVRPVVNGPAPEALLNLPAPETKKGERKVWSLDLTIPTSETERASMSLLDERLRELGINASSKRAAAPTIFRKIDVHRNSFTSEIALGETETRAWVNREVRRVFEEERLGRLPRLPGDMPIYARVFIVGDLGEAMVRRLAQPVVRCIHAELRRSVYPIFDGRFDGHTRPLTVNPYFSMPHPADTTAEKMIAGEQEQNATLFNEFSPQTRTVRERVIVDALHGLRRWMELVPEKERLGFELLVSGRVTDRAVMTRDDAIEEMRAFIWMNARNVVADDDLLNRILTNQNSDILSTVAFRELSFPAERARSWLSNRTSRALLRTFTEHVEKRDEGIAVAEDEGADVWRLPTSTRGESLKRTGDEAAVGALASALEANSAGCAQLADSISKSIKSLDVPWAADAEYLLEKDFAPSQREVLIEQPILNRRRDWVRDRGVFDTHMTEVRRRSARQLSEGRREVVRIADRLVAEERGLLYMKAGFENLRRKALDYVSDSQDTRVKAEARVMKHRRPDPRAMTDAAWKDLEEAIKKKPDQKPLLLGAVSASIAMTHVLNALVSVWVARLLVNWASSSTDPLNPPWLMERVIELLLFSVIGIGAWRLRRHTLQKAADRIKEARDEVAKAAVLAVSGEHTHSLAPFFEARLRHRWEVARQGHAQFTWNRVGYDYRMAERIGDAAATRLRLLTAEVEGYGVRVKRGDGGKDMDEPSRLFRTRVGTGRSWLVSPETVDAWYKQRTHDEADNDLRQQLDRYFEQHRPFARWREEAPFGDNSLSAFSRGAWEDLVGEAVISDDAIFRAEAQKNIGAFVARHFGSMGYGVKFRGYEGFDEDGIDDSELRLLVPESFRIELESTLSGGYGAAELLQLSDDRRSMLERVEKSFVELRPNAIFLMMVALGVRERSFRNIQRYDSFYERKQLPESERFPFSGMGLLQRSSAEQTPLHQFSYHRLISDPSVARDGETS